MKSTMAQEPFSFRDPPQTANDVGEPLPVPHPAGAIYLKNPPSSKEQIESLQRALAEAQGEARKWKAEWVSISMALEISDRKLAAVQARFETVRKDWQEAQSMTERWKKAIEGLTPSGSEYVDDPERCAEYIRQRWSSSADRLRSSRTEIAALREHLAETETEIDRLRAALKGQG